MYSLEGIIQGIKNPRLIVIEFNRIYNSGIRVRSTPGQEGLGIDVVSADWDNLIILDACRFDVFEQFAENLPGELRKVRSRGSNTEEFLRANFSDRNLFDSVYVTANPQLYRIENGIYDVEPINVTFHKQIDLWQDGWHDEHRTVMPDTVAERAREVAERYPNKRLIVHFLQPHAPFIGPTGVEQLPSSQLDFWKYFLDGEYDVSLETLKMAYRENLEAVLPHVSDLFSDLRGKTVVTADHGELFGERDKPIPLRRFGHPSHTYMPALIEVPWHVYEFNPRPEIIAESPDENGTEMAYDADIVRKRLQDLGYVEPD